MGVMRTSFDPIVLMIFHPPQAVPAAMVIAQVQVTQLGISNSSIFKNPIHSGEVAKTPAEVAVKRLKVIIPMVF